MSLISFFTNNEWVSVSLGTAVSIGYAYTLKKVLSASSEKRKSEQKRFIEALNKGLNNKKVNTFSEIENLYKGVRGIGGDDELNKVRLAKWLRLAYVENIESADIADSGSSVAINQILCKFVEEAEKAAPYSGLPELERNIVKDLETYITNNHIDDAKRKIEELSSAIQIREESLVKLESTNRWSVPLSVIGLILTIIFGITSIIK